MQPKGRQRGLSQTLLGGWGKCHTGRTSLTRKLKRSMCWVRCSNLWWCRSTPPIGSSLPCQPRPSASRIQCAQWPQYWICPWAGQSPTEWSEGCWSSRPPWLHFRCPRPLLKIPWLCHPHQQSLGVLAYQRFPCFIKWNCHLTTMVRQWSYFLRLLMIIQNQWWPH